MAASRKAKITSHRLPNADKMDPVAREGILMEPEFEKNEVLRGRYPETVEAPGYCGS